MRDRREDLGLSGASHCIRLKILFMGFQYCGLTRLTPPKTGEIFITVLMISSGSFVERQTGKASMFANSLQAYFFFTAKDPATDIIFIPNIEC